MSIWYFDVSIEPAETAGLTTTRGASGQAIASPGAAKAVGTVGTPAAARSAR